MTVIIILSGVHGSGKTVVAQELAKRLRQANQTVYYASEMSFPLDIPIETLEFQISFKQQIQIRNSMIENLQKYGYKIGINDFRFVDYVILDRDLLDIDIYTIRLLNPDGADLSILASLIEIKNNFVNKHHYILERDTFLILRDLEMRLEQDIHRQDWNELSTNYILDIRAMFEMYADVNDDISIINNKNIPETVEQILGDVYYG